MQVLSRRTKNNPVLIGEPGVGKTAIVEGLVAADRRQRRPRHLEGQAALHPRPRSARRRQPLPRRLRGAPEEGAEGDPTPRRHHLVHRRAAHARRCRCGRRCDRRRVDPEADARPRRAADHRCHDARRVPQAPREGRRARAALPADQGRRALARAHDRDLEGAARPVRAAPPGDDHRPGARRRGEPRRPLHLGPLPAGQGDRPDRRGRRAVCASAGCRRRPSTARSRRTSSAIRAEKEAALERQNFEQAKKLADQEQAKLERKTALEQEWRSEGVDLFDVVDEDVIAEVLAELDRDPGLQAHRGGDRQARAHGGGAAQADRRPRGRNQRACPGRSAAPAPG